LSTEELSLALDTVWVLVTAFLVFFMQAGFALVEAGLTRAKNVGNIVMKNLMDFAIGTLAFFTLGFAIMFGHGNGFAGHHGWFLGGDAFDSLSWTQVPLSAKFLFQLVFAGTAATIVSGAMAERTRFKAYIVYSAGISAFIYPVVGHWIWGGGWLASKEFLDFAGSTVVHSTGGWAALMGAAILGPRMGKFGPDGKPRAILGHSMPLVVLGTLILWFGWYGFNPGSTMAANPTAMAHIAVTTTLAAAIGGFVAMLLIWLKTGKPDVSMTCNGVLAGLVAITAGCAFVETWAALIIGGVAGALVIASVTFFDRVRIDDPVGAISVHGACGAFGTLAVGLFASDRLIEAAGVGQAGVFYGGGAHQLGVQALGVVAVLGFVVAASGLLFLLLKSTIGLRVPYEEEMMGLDMAEHGAPGYAPDMVTGSFRGTQPDTSTPAAPVEVDIQA
jgi:Amt family ammonium transporter